jgi:penicillin-binding protein 2
MAVKYKKRTFRKLIVRTIDSRKDVKFNRPALRLTVLFLLVLILFSVILTRLWFVQILNTKQYDKAVNADTIRTVSVPAVRGLIYDRNGNLLVGNKVVQEVTLSRQVEKTDPQVVGRLAAILSMTPQEVLTALNNVNYSIYQPVPIKTDISVQTAALIEQDHLMLPGVKVQLSTERYYPQGDLLAQVLGYVGNITPAELKEPQYKGFSSNAQVGQAGVELTYDKQLQGTPGQIVYEVNSLNQPVKILSEKPAIPGKDIVLPIDLSLQQQAEQDLYNQIIALRNSVDPTTGIHPPAPGGAVVILDPNNGHVLAMASYPTYNPSMWVGGISQANYQAITSSANHEPLLNRAISGLYTPGSTFKLATATAALNTGLITPYTTIDDTGIFTIPQPCSGKCSFHNAGYEALGYLSLTKAIGASDDVFFYTLGYDFWVNRNKYGPTPIQNYAAQYGFGQLTGINLPYESKGRVDSPQTRLQLHNLAPSAFPHYHWYVGDNLEMAFGQGETVITPIQLADAYATLANGGIRYVPQIVADIATANGKQVQAVPNKVAATVSLPATTRSTLIQGFTNAIAQPYGTAYGIFQGFPLSSFPLAGKTGTASTNHIEPDALFVAFGPTNSPKYVVAAVVEQGGYGDLGAAPIVRNLMQYLMNNSPQPISIPTANS